MFSSKLLTHLLLIVSYAIYRDNRENKSIKSITINELMESYDYIVVGGGTAGCVVARRLAEDDKNIVLLIEAGDVENIVSQMPAMYSSLPQRDMVWDYSIKPQKSACFGYNDNSFKYNSARVLGGGSAINSMSYGRGSTLDYDNWSENGAHDWTWNDVLPSFIALENNTDNKVLTRSGTYNNNGPQVVSSVTKTSLLTQTFFKAAKVFGLKRLKREELVIQGFVQKQLTMDNGRRCSTARGYIYPVANSTNLHIMTNALVERILFDKDLNAIGVEVKQNNKSFNITSHEEVILTAGAINSPFILMKSGIGRRNYLRRFGIEPYSDLPVGYNLQDHVSNIGVVFTVNLTKTGDLMNFENIKNYFKPIRGGVLAEHEVPAIYLQTKYANDSRDWPDLMILVSKGSPADHKDYNSVKEYTNIRKIIWDSVFRPFRQKSTITITPVLIRPKSRGSIDLKRRGNSLEPEINPNYLTNNIDLNTMIEGLKSAYNLGLSQPFKAIGAQPLPIPFKSCENFLKKKTIKHLPSDAYLRCVAKLMTNSLRHASGTCRMGSESDKRSVVNTELKVINTKRLRVCDASVMPFITSGVTNVPTIMIGEECAKMALNELTGNR